MASRFVSGGTLEKSTERDDEWLQAQQELEEKRRRGEEYGKQQDGKSLYEVLQKNKAEKEEAFQESIKLKNQFRALNDDEVDFLDATLEATRAKEEAVKKETTEQLERFRQLRQEADKAIEQVPDALNENADAADVEGEEPEDNVDWNISTKKRKRTKDKEGLKGLKVRRTSSNNDERLDADEATSKGQKEPQKTPSNPEGSHSLQKTSANYHPPAAKHEASTSMSGTREDARAPPTGGLALVGYDSDDDSE